MFSLAPKALVPVMQCGWLVRLVLDDRELLFQLGSKPRGSPAPRGQPAAVPTSSPADSPADCSPVCVGNSGPLFINEPNPDASPPLATTHPGGYTPVCVGNLAINEPDPDASPPLPGPEEHVTLGKRPRSLFDDTYYAHKRPRMMTELDGTDWLLPAYSGIEDAENNNNYIDTVRLEY